MLAETYHNYDRYKLFEVKNKMGVSVNFWSLKNKDVSFSNAIQLMHLIKVLHVSHKFVKKGLPYAIDTLNKVSTKAKKKELDIPLIVKYLNAATLLYPFKTKCLEWSVALFYYIIQYGYRPVLKIGVQNRPFYSHAWIEIYGEVIGDVKDLNEKLTVIYQINLDINNVQDRCGFQKKQ